MIPDRARLAGLVWYNTYRRPYLPNAALVRVRRKEAFSKSQRTASRDPTSTTLVDRAAKERTVHGSRPTDVKASARVGLLVDALDPVLDLLPTRGGTKTGSTATPSTVMPVPKDAAGRDVRAHATIRTRRATHPVGPMDKVHRPGLNPVGSGVPDCGSIFIPQSIPICCLVGELYRAAALPRAAPGKPAYMNTDRTRWPYTATVRTGDSELGATASVAQATIPVLLPDVPSRLPFSEATERADGQYAHNASHRRGPVQ